MGVVVLGLAVFAVVALVRMGKKQSLSTYRSGAEILAERFARGEIDAELFHSMKQELERNS